MIEKKNRDVKFIIYQSLYIFVIAMLALNGNYLDFTEVVPAEIPPPDTLTKFIYDPSTDIVLPKPAENAQYQPVLPKDTIVTKETLADKDKRISVLERMKTPTNVSRTTRTPTESVPKSDVTGGRPVEK